MDSIQQLLLHSPATLGLMIANVVLSFMAFQNVRLVDRMIYDVSLIRRRGEWWRMITSGFIHGDPFHLLMNMLGLYFMGPSLEYVVGTTSFLVLYFVALMAGSLWTWMEHHRDPGYRALGASGAISGVTTAIALFAPFAQINALYFLPMPLIVFAVCYIVWSAWAASTSVRDGIGHSAHLGGALAGVAMVCLFWPGAVRRLWEQFLATLPTTL